MFQKMLLKPEYVWAFHNILLGMDERRLQLSQNILCKLNIPSNLIV